MARLANEVRVHVDKARESALLAVETYNRPSTSFRTGGFVVLMCIAWTALLHAVFFKRKMKPFYRQAHHRGRFQIVDGDRKAWELSTCLQEFWGGVDSPIRKNISFFIGLRNKIEHRSMPALDTTIFGECQALLFNFEDLIVSEFGDKHALNESLSISLQFSRSRNEERQNAIRRMQRSLAKNISAYVSEFRSSLGTDVLNDSRFSYKVFLIPKPANREAGADIAVEFVKFDPSNPDEMEKYERIVSLIKPSAAALANVSASAGNESGIGSSANIRLVSDPDAVTFGSIDYDRTHPLIQKALIATVNAQLPRGVVINSHDILSVRRSHGIEEIPNFCHKGLFGPTQYSYAFANWIVEQYARDNSFFAAARAAYKVSR